MDAPQTVSYDDFAKLDLRTATVLEARPHPNADELMILRVGLGVEMGERQIVAGIRPHYTPEEMKGMQIVIVANLEPRSLRGEMSHGMLLACHDDRADLSPAVVEPEGELKKLVLIVPGQIAKAGLKIG